MEVIIRIEKDFYPKHHLVQLHQKPITTTKAFSFLYKRTIHHFHLFRYRASLYQRWPLNSVRVKASRPLVQYKLWTCTMNCLYVNENLTILSITTTIMSKVIGIKYCFKHMFGIFSSVYCICHLAYTLVAQYLRCCERLGTKFCSRPLVKNADQLAQ